MSQQISGMISGIESLSLHAGPGRRTSVYFSGCPLQCSWCSGGHKQEKSENMTVDEIMQVLQRDRSEWGPDGGVTFTGGEPLLQHEFLDALLQRCIGEQIHTAIETSAYAAREHFMKIFRQIAFAFVELKTMDDAKHRNATGVSNVQILSNIAALAHSDWHGRLVLRQPVISGFNDGTDNALRTIDFMNENGLFEINLLRYHPVKNISDISETSEETLKTLQTLYLRHDIACYPGENAPF